MNPYNRFSAISSLLASSIVLAGIVAFGPTVRETIFQVAGERGVARWGGLVGAGFVLLIVWSVLSGIILPGLLKLGWPRRWVLGRSFVEGSWIQAERGGPNGPRIAIVTLKPARNGILISSSTLTRIGEVESGLHAEYLGFNWPRIDFKFRETLPIESGRQAEGFGEVQFDLTGGAPTRYSGCLQFAGAEKRIKTEGIKLTSWKERRKLRSLEGRAEVLGKYWSAFFEGPIVSSGREEHAEVKRGKRPEKVRERTAKDWRKTDTTPTANRIREEFTATGD
ncbi:hypothetical protein [Hyphomonas atlantica]|uniref:SMODS-associating 2TM beta-strand rich effector domain-containing protein n=1 Tax=Hyphomonas atlantica TaxID=1280948 RepID=A0A059E9A0_9PROT|nr:hypothetical protein [Hyphomonas atlantica]KCZ64479.1 hypothetical protein HY36_12865 [Hyphomonas atlantica]